MFCKNISIQCLRTLRGNANNRVITDQASRIPKQPTHIIPNILTRREAITALSEDDMVELAETNSKKKLIRAENVRPDSYIKKPQMNTYEQSKLRTLATEISKKQQLLKPVTEEDQYEMLSKVVLPLKDIPYEAQMKMKFDFARKVLCKMNQEMTSVGAPILAHINQPVCSMGSVRPSPNIFHYRNKTEFSIHYGVDGDPKTVGLFVGSLANENMRCVPATQLMNMNQPMKNVAEHFQAFIRASSHPTCMFLKEGGVWRNLVVRSTEEGELMAIVIINSMGLNREESVQLKYDLEHYFFEGPGRDCALTSLYLQESVHVRSTPEQAPFQLLAGKRRITEKIVDMKFEIGPDSFFQINTQAAEVLFNAVHKNAGVSSTTTVVDLCCGTGIFGLLLAPDVRGLIGIDRSSTAITDARINASNNNITNSNFIHGSVGKILPIIQQDLAECSNVVAILNPPRGGTDASVMRAIRECESINKLIFVSCKPHGDCMRNFADLGAVSRNRKFRLPPPFVPTHAVPVDMFPHTSHLEIAFVFERQNE